MDKEDKMKDFALGKLNFMLMSGGGTTDGVSFNPAIFSKQRISVAPIVTMAGFILMVFGILVGDRKRSSTNQDTTEA